MSLTSIAGDASCACTLSCDGETASGAEAPLRSGGEVASRARASSSPERRVASFVREHRRLVETCRSLKGRTRHRAKILTPQGSGVPRQAGVGGRNSKRFRQQHGEGVPLEEREVHRRALRDIRLTSLSGMGTGPSSPWAISRGLVFVLSRLPGKPLLAKKEKHGVDSVAG